ncbi:MAG: phosphate ABC transporter substrate-binding/OmpA family protein [Pseudomonadota bacterium]
MSLNSNTKWAGLAAQTAIALAMMGSSVASADEVIITSRTSGASVNGDLLSFNGEIYIVDTELGRLQFAVEDVICEGASCPAVELGERLVPDTPLAPAVTPTTSVASSDSDDDDDDDEITIEGFEPDVEMIASIGIADQLLPVIAEGLGANMGLEAIIRDQDGNPLVEDAPKSAEEEGAVLIRFAGEEEGGNEAEEDELAYLIRVGEEEEAVDELADGDVEIIFLDEPAEPDDVAEVARGGGGDLRTLEQERILAVEGLAAVVHPSNPIQSLRIEDIVGIVSGRITDWSQVGGQPGRIDFYSFDEEDEAFHYIDELVLEEYDIEVREDATRIRTNRELAAAVTADPLGFGLISAALKRGSRAVPVVSECGLTSVPTGFNLKTEDYPLQRRIYAYNRRTLSPESRRFIDFIDSREIDGLVAKAGFVDLSIIEETRDDAQSRIARLVSSTNDAYELGLMRQLLLELNASRRLSTTFRFAVGSSALDNRAKRDIRRMIDYIEAAQPREVLVVGFTDSVGAFDSNTALAQSRARSVLREIVVAGGPDLVEGISLTPVGYGELAPVACNDTLDGRSVNRRVEIWLR